MFENVDGRTDDGRRTPDAGVTGILIAHLGAFGSGELKTEKKKESLQDHCVIASYSTAQHINSWPRENLNLKVASETCKAGSLCLVDFTWVDPGGQGGPDHPRKTQLAIRFPH